MTTSISSDRLETECIAQNGIQLARARDANGTHALSFGQCAEIDAGELSPGQVFELEVMPEIVERLIAPVADHDEHDAQTQLRGRPQRLNRIQAGAVAHQRDHAIVGPRERHADRGRQAVTQPTARTGVEGIRLEDRQVVVHRAAAARRLFHDDAVGRTQLLRSAAGDSDP